MHDRVCKIIYSMSFIMFISGIVFVSWRPEAAYQALGATLAGAGCSLLISTFLQRWASDEQSQLTSKLLRDLTLQTEGVKALPSEFRDLNWMAYATRVPDGGAKKIDWRICELHKIGASGEATCMYSLRTRNCNGKDVKYTCTFVGLAGRVACIIAKGIDTERTALMVFETAVSDTHIYFGPGYIVDWLAENAFTLAMVGAGSMPSSMNGIPATALESFTHWFNKTEWSVKEVFEAHKANC